MDYLDGLRFHKKVKLAARKELDEEIKAINQKISEEVERRDEENRQIMSSLGTPEADALYRLFSTRHSEGGTH